MFGYIRPAREELKVGDFDRYKALYCSLCHTIKRKYGRFAHLFLNYDFTFLAMVLSRGEQPEITIRRCAAAPLRGKAVCRADDAIETAADTTVIFTYWKLRDNVADNGFFRGLPARVAAVLLYRAYRKAARSRPEFDHTVTSCLAELRALEQAGCTSLDQVADTFARLLSAAAPSSGEGDRDRVSQQILYHVGRWIYLVDAWDDLEEDRKEGKYNPLLLRSPQEPETLSDSLRTTLRHSLNLAASAYHLGSFGCWNEILGNILFLGLPMTEELVFSGRWKQAKKIWPGGRNHFRRE